MFVPLLQGAISTAKVTLRTLWTYEHHLLLLFMEWHPPPPLPPFQDPVSAHVLKYII